MSDEKEIKEEQGEGRKAQGVNDQDSASEQTKEETIFRLENELKDANEKYLRVLAEEQNLIKRQTAEKEEFVKYANQEIVSEFIGVYDHLKLSIGSLPEAEKKSAWVKGVEYTVKQFKDLLAVNGVEEIKTAGEKFNPAEMEAVDGQGEKVTKEIMPGYKLNGKVIRAARVTLE